MNSEETASDVPSSYPYPELLVLVPKGWTPAGYRQLTNGLLSYELWDDAERYAAYWGALPRTTFAHCPFCLTPFHCTADSFSLAGWGSEGVTLASEFYHNPGPVSVRPWCRHFVGIHQFINLHNVVPTELTNRPNPSAEVPYLNPGFFRSDFTTYAVLQAQPICRVEGDQFVPRYTVFSLTYFADDPRGLLRVHYAEQHAWAGNDPEFYASALALPPGKTLDIRLDEMFYDLPHWALSNRLGWVDWLAPHRLWLRPNLQLPAIYQSIAGRRTPYNWRNGRFRDRY